MNPFSDFAQVTESSVIDVNAEFNSNLKHLCLRGVLQYSTDGIGVSLLGLIRFFSSFAESSRLEKIELELEVANALFINGSLDWSLWKGVDQLLAGPRFKCLQEVDIYTTSLVDLLRSTRT
jgi:hypothetical protein